MLHHVFCRMLWLTNSMCSPSTTADGISGKKHQFTCDATVTRRSSWVLLAVWRYEMMVTANCFAVEKKECCRSQTNVKLNSTDTAKREKKSTYRIHPKIPIESILSWSIYCKLLRLYIHLLIHDYLRIYLMTKSIQIPLSDRICSEYVCQSSFTKGASKGGW